MNVWKILISIQKHQMYFLNKLVSIGEFVHFNRRRKAKRNNAKIIGELNRKSSLTIVMNGPSINNQNFELLIGEDVMFGNRGFNHPLYRKIKPKFHVFVDPKLKKGIWPTEWLDEILEMNPDVIFVMPVAWMKLDMLKPYISRRVKFLWISDNHTFIGGIGVAGAAIRTGILAGYKTINITGFEKTGFAHELLKQASHFYGVNDENNTKTWDDYTTDFYMNFLFYVGLKEEAKKWRKQGIEIFNVTDGGLIEVFPRKKFDEIYAE